MNSKDQHMRKLGPGGITPSRNVFFQAGIGVAVQGTISLVVRPCRLHGADELIAFHGASGDQVRAKWTMRNSSFFEMPSLKHLCILICRAVWH